MADFVDQVQVFVGMFLTQFFADYTLHFFAGLAVILIILAVFIITKWTMP